MILNYQLDGLLCANHGPLMKELYGVASVTHQTLALIGKIPDAAHCLSLFEFRVAFDGWLAPHISVHADLRELVSSGECLPEFTPLLEKMLTFDSLTTAGWRDGRRFHIRVRQVLGTACGHHRLDAFLCPTVRRHPVSLEKMPPGCAPELAAMSGLPAITLPCGMAETGLPVGMEMLGTVRDELRLMAYAQHVERVLGDMT